MAIMVNNENLKFRNSFRRVLGAIAKKETAEFYMLYKLLTAGGAEMQKERFYEVFGKTEELNPDRLSKKKFMARMDDLGVDLPELITNLCKQMFGQKLAESQKVFDCTLHTEEGVI